jgi:hypothetical protein
MLWSITKIGVINILCKVFKSIPAFCVSNTASTFIFDVAVVAKKLRSMTATLKEGVNKNGFL